MLTLFIGVFMVGMLIFLVTYFLKNPNKSDTLIICNILMRTPERGCFHLTT